MFETRPRSASSSARSSTVLLVIALVATATVVVFGSIAVWNLYESAYAGPESGAPTTFASTAEPLRVGIARTCGGPNEWITFAKVLAQLQRDLNRPVVVRYALSSEDQTRLLEREEIDVVLMSTLAYLDVQAAEIVTMVATPVVLNEPMDAAVMVVRTDSDAERIEDLRGGRFAASADLAGVSFAYWLLEEWSEDPEGFFSTAAVGVQDVNLTKVAKGEADVTSVRRSALATWPEGVFRVIGHSPDLGMPPIVARKSLDDATVDQVRQSLLSAVSRGVVPTTSVITGFRAATDAEYDFARVLDAVDRDSEFSAFGIVHQ